MDRIKYLVLPFIGLWTALLAIYVFVVAVAVPHEWLGMYTVFFQIIAWFVLPAILFLWLHPKRKLFKWEKGGTLVGEVFFLMSVTGLFIGQLIVVQQHFDIEYSSLNEVENVSEFIEAGKRGKYINVRTSYVDLAHLKSTVVVYPGDKYSRAEMCVAITCPLRDNAADTSQPLVWLGMEYSRKLQRGEKVIPEDQLCIDYLLQCLGEFRAMTATPFFYLERIDATEFRRQFRNVAVYGNGELPSVSATIFWPVYSSFEYRGEESLSGMFGYYGIVVGLISVLLALWDMHGANWQRYVPEERQKWRKRWNILRILSGRRDTGTA